MKLPRYVLPMSVVGTVIGASITVKDYLAGDNYNKMDKIVGTTAIVTGANTGIGKETAKGLAKRGARVIMACRDPGKCELARAEIIMESNNRNVECMFLDLASIANIRAFAKRVNEQERHVDVLVNNAGIMNCPRQLTKDGFEMQLGVNHLGHFLLTYLLLDKLKASAPSRIVNVSSMGHRRGKINFDDLNSAKLYDPTEAYDQSKLANMLFTMELAKRLEGTGVTANAVHPGVVKTDINRYTSLKQSYFSGVVLKPLTWLMVKTPTQGAMNSIFAAVDPELTNVSGKYFSNLKEKEPAPQAKDMDVARRLWAISEVWTRVKDTS